MFKAPQKGDRVTGLTVKYADGMEYTFEMHATIGDGTVGRFIARSTPSQIATVVMHTDGPYDLFSLGAETIYGAEWH